MRAPSPSPNQTDTEIDPTTGAITTTSTTQADGTRSIDTKTTTADGTLTFLETSLVEDVTQTASASRTFNDSGDPIHTWVSDTDPVRGIETNSIVGSVATADGYVTQYRFSWNSDRDGSSIFAREHDRSDGRIDRFTASRSVDGSTVTTSEQRPANRGRVKVTRILDRLGDGVQQVRRYDLMDTELSGEQIQVVAGKTEGASVPLGPEFPPGPEPEPEPEPLPEPAPITLPEPGLEPASGPEPEPGPTE